MTILGGPGEQRFRGSRTGRTLCLAMISLIAAMVFIHQAVQPNGKDRSVELALRAYSRPLPSTEENHIISKQPIKEEKLKRKKKEPELTELEKNYNSLVGYMRSNYTAEKIQSILPKKKLMKVCQNLPETNKFGDLSAKMEFSNDVLYYHFILMYKILKPIHFCAIEGLLTSLQNSSSSYSKIEVTLWMSEDEALHSAMVYDYLPTLYHHDESGRVTVTVKALDFKDVFSGTPFEGFYNCFNFLGLSLGEWEKQNKGNAARLAMLYKYGGFYLDLDFIIAKDVSNLKDGVAMQQPQKFNTAALKFTSRTSRLFVMSLMKQWVVDFIDKWGKNGPALFNRAILARKQCTVSGEGTNDVAYHCHYGVVGETAEINIWPSDDFYPLSHVDYKVLLKNDTQARQNSPELDAKLKNPALVHLWHHLSGGLEDYKCRGRWKIYSETLIGNLRRLHCPVVYNTLANNGCH